MSPVGVVQLCALCYCAGLTWNQLYWSAHPSII